MSCHLNLVMVKCPQCKEEVFAGFTLMPGEVAWFNALTSLPEHCVICPECFREITWSRPDAYLKDVRSPEFWHYIAEFSQVTAKRKP
jgi:hypothetical protein